MLKVYEDIRRGSLERGRQTTISVVENDIFYFRSLFSLEGLEISLF